MTKDTTPPSTDSSSDVLAHDKSDVRTTSRLLPWFIWRLIPHTHGVKDMNFLGIYKPGEYEIWECKRCKYREAL